MSSPIPTISPRIKEAYLNQPLPVEQPKAKPTPKRDPWDVRAAGRSFVWLMRIWKAWNWMLGLGFVYMVAKHGPKWYPLSRAFVIAHLWGWATKDERKARIEKCSACPYRYVHVGKEYCRGDNGGRGCGCGHWVASRLDHKVGLAGFRCPQGRFGYGGLRKLVARK